MYRINPGEFKNPIEILKYVLRTDEDNIPVKSYEVILSTKARILNISGKEKVLNDGVSSVSVKRFYIRYKKDLDITTGDIILYKDKKYNITYVSNVEEKDVYLEIVGELME